MADAAPAGAPVDASPPRRADGRGSLRNNRGSQARGIGDRFRSLLGLKKSPRAPSSGGDPSSLAGQRIDGEEDILHIRHLPQFGGRLKARDCELLLSYLTAPYLRIALLMNFGKLCLQSCVELY